MKRKELLVLIVVIFFSLNLQAQSPKLKKAFNGKNLKCWVAPDNNIWWTAKDGILSARSGPEKQGSILWTKKDYKDFVIEAEFLMGKGTVDSGIFIRTDTQQIQIGESGSLKRDMTCSPYIPGKGYPVEATDIDKLMKLNDWNTIKVRAIGNQYTTWLNGEEVMNYTSTDGIAEGPIGLQLHPKRNMEIDFRNIRIGKVKS
ncbi:MAG: hypothetical protein ACI9FN_002601 [Saprospiraceae bacterium]|jgi:hypothetical protein